MRVLEVTGERLIFYTELLRPAPQRPTKYAGAGDVYLAQSVPRVGRRRPTKHTGVSVMALGGAV
eukprot:2204701-Prymnesium_polylepis.1